MNTTTQNSRRSFLKKMSLSGGGFMLGFSLFDEAIAMPSLTSDSMLAATVDFNSYLSIAADGMITISSPNPELGQYIRTSFARIVADELDADWSKVNVIQPPLDTKKFERQLTGGSGAIPHSWKRLRTAGATARQMLINAAAEKWNVAATDCSTDNGFVVHVSSGKKVSYGELAEAASKVTVPTDVKLKDPKQFKFIGKSIKNVENKNIVTGKGLFGLDFYREGMMYAMVQHPPAFGTKIKSIDDQAAKAIPGVTDVVRFKNLSTQKKDLLGLFYNYNYFYLML